MLEAHHLVFTGSDNQLLESFAEPSNGPAAAEEQFLGPVFPEGLREDLTVKLEPIAEDFLSVSQIRMNNCTEKSQMWTSAADESTEPPDPTICVLLQDVKYRLGSPAGRADEPQEYTSQIKDLTCPDKETYSVMDMEPRSSDVANALKLTDAQEVVVGDFCSVSDRIHQDEAYDFNTAASGSFQDPSRQSSYICSNCGQSFDSFGTFQEHRCEKPPQPALGCEICGKTFNQMSILKLHLKLHVK